MLSHGDQVTNVPTTNSSSKMRGSEKTPLIDSARMTESFVNKGVADMSTGVSWGVAAFLLVNTALGAGMLNYPYAYNQIGGVLAAGLMQIILLVFITSTMFVLVYCADFNQDNTYHDVLLSMCGKRAQQISALSILLTCYGINVTFLVIIGDQYDRIFNSLLTDYTDEYWFLDRKFTIFITSVLFIWPMCYAQRLDFLRHASILGMFAMLYVAFLTVYEHYQLDDVTKAAIANRMLIETISGNNHTHATFQPAKHSVQWFEPLAIIPVLCFAYQTHEVIVPVYACMKKRHIGHFMKASIFGLVILFFLYNLVGAYGYLTFGADVGADIMSLYDAKDPVVIVGIVALVIKFITTYPPLMFCGRGALDGLYGELRKLSAAEFNACEKQRRIIITTIWFFSTVALAVFAPDISVTLQLLGSMASINVFVFPGMCMISLTRRLRRARQALLLDETNNDNACSPYNQQRARDYYIISGSYFGAMNKAKNEAINQRRALSNCQSQNGSETIGQRQNFTATFASLIEFENNMSQRYGEHSKAATNGLSRQQRFNGYGTNTTSSLRQQQQQQQVDQSSNNSSSKRQDEFEKLISNGVSSAQDHHQYHHHLQAGSLNKRTLINDSYDDYTECDGLNQECDMISPMILDDNNRHANSITSASCAHRLTDSKFSNSSNNTNPNNYNNNDPANQDRLSNNHHRQACLQNNSWNNRSTTGSILERFGNSIAPSTVAQIGISKCTATGLYLYSALLIIFGAFIFVLELVNLFGFL